MENFIKSSVPVPMRGMAVDPINPIDTTYTMTYDGVTGYHELSMNGWRSSYMPET